MNRTASLAIVAGLTILLAFVVWIVPHMNDVVEIPQYMYGSDLAKGERVVFYTEEGVYEYDSKAGTTTQLFSRSGPLGTASTPILSPDWTKLVFFAFSRDGYDLWLYDFPTHSASKLLERVEGYDTYYTYPRWSKNSKSIYLTLKGTDYYKIYEADLSGILRQVPSEYDGNTFLMKVLSGNRLLFLTDLSVAQPYGGDMVGVVDSLTGNYQLFEPPSLPEYASFDEPDDEVITKVNVDAQTFSNFDHEFIYGLEKLTLADGKFEKVPLPIGVLDRSKQGFVNLHPILNCGGGGFLGGGGAGGD